MSVYNDMASDAGYKYGTDENRQMAQMIEQEHLRQAEAEMKTKAGAWMECPKCNHDLGIDYEPYFTLTRSGSGYNSTFEMVEHWWEGYLTCPECKYHWYFMDSSL